MKGDVLWSRRNAAKARARSGARRGTTIVEILVVIAIIGILIALFISYLKSSIEAAKKIYCQNNQANVGKAFQFHLITTECFPPNRPAPWSVTLAPYLGEPDYYASYDLRYEANSSQNAPLGKTCPNVYLCPSQPIIHVGNHWIVSNCAANVNLIKSGMSLNACTDGFSHTGFLVEIAGKRGIPVILGPVVSLTTCREDIHTGTFNMLFMDGGVRSVSANINPMILAAWGTPNGGERVDDEF